MAWAYRTGKTGTFTRFLTLDPKGVMGTGAGIRLGTHLRTNGYSFFTSGNRGVFLADNTLAGAGTFPAWSSINGNSKVTFGDTHLYFVTNGLALQRHQHFRPCRGTDHPHELAHCAPQLWLGGGLHRKDLVIYGHGADGDVDYTLS